MKRFLDTNVLLYSISTSPDESEKRSIAISALESTDNVLSVQVLQEFYEQATRQTRPDALPHSLAVGFIEAWERFPIVETTQELVHHALDLRARRGWSYWDAVIVAAALAGGCIELWSEDLNHGQREGPLQIIDPFR